MICKKNTLFKNLLSLKKRLQFMSFLLMSNSVFTFINAGSVSLIVSILNDANSCIHDTEHSSGFDNIKLIYTIFKVSSFHDQQRRTGHTLHVTQRNKRANLMHFTIKQLHPPAHQQNTTQPRCDGGSDHGGAASAGSELYSLSPLRRGRLSPA